jgi:hypothetical protein
LASSSSFYLYISSCSFLSFSSLSFAWATLASFFAYFIASFSASSFAIAALILGSQLYALLAKSNNLLRSSFSYFLRPFLFYCSIQRFS